jgi:hypothetical protein
MGPFYSVPFNLAIYLASFGLLLAGMHWHTNLTIWVALALYLIWDIGFVLSRRAFTGRNIENILSQATLARTLVSYFLPFYGVLFGVLFVSDSAQQVKYIHFLDRAGVSPALLIAPFLIAGVGSLFIPIQISDTGSGEPSRSLKSLFFTSVFLEKLAIFMFVHIVLRMLDSIGVG